MSAAACFRDLYARHKREELPEAIKELSRLENLVSQQRAFVTQLKQDCDTKQVKCDTGKREAVLLKLKYDFKPEYYLGKEINDILVTQEMVDEVNKLKQEGK